MSAHEELQRDGVFGVHCLRLLTRLMRREAEKARTLEAQGERPGLTVDDLVQKFFVSKGKAVTRMLYATARSDDQFGAMLCQSVKNWLIDRSRSATDPGALRFRLEKLLRTRPEFALVPDGQPGAGRWRLADGPDEVFAGDVGDLATAGRVVPVKPVVWNSKTRRAPVTDTPSLVRLLERIFDTAVGTLELGQIVYAVRGRFHAQFAGEIAFDHRADPSSRLVAATAAAETAESGLDAEESEARIAFMAIRLCDRLDNDGLRILDVLDDLDEIAARLAVGRTQAYAHRAKVRAVLAELIADDPYRAAILAEARLLAPGPPA